MTTEELNNKIRDCIVTNCQDQIPSFYKQYLIGRCHHPIKVRVVDSMTNEIKYIEVPCGKCIHCRETKISEWVERLYAHSESYKYVYFTTLTYRSFPIESNPIYDACIDYLSSAIWHKDDYNYDKELAFHPCLLVKEHYQQFLKRLRISLPSIAGISYLLCGEYGKRYARPHFHLILFSHIPISKIKIVSAWSIQLHQNADGSCVRHTSQKDNNFSVPIGRVQHIELKSSGNFDQTRKYKVEGSNKSANQCFAYVCKYMLKEDFNSNRLDLAYSALFPSAPIGSFDKPVYKRFISNWKNRVSHLQVHTYFDCVSKDDLSPRHMNFIKSFNIENYSFIYEKFTSKHRPFIEVSRTKAIGADFLHSHLEEYQAGNFIKPQYYSGCLTITPQYFLRKVTQSIFSLDKCTRTINQNSSFAKGSYYNLRSDLFSSDFRSLFNCAFDVVNWRQSIVGFVMQGGNKWYNYKDKFLNIRYLLVRCKNELRVNQYRFNRSTHLYDYVDSTSFDFFASSMLHRLNILYSRYYEQQFRLSQESIQQKTLNNLLASCSFTGIDSVTDSKPCFETITSGSHNFVVTLKPFKDNIIVPQSELTRKIRSEIRKDYYDYIKLHRFNHFNTL